MAVWGYARVSKEDQRLALQLDALEAAGVPAGHVVTDELSGARKRPAFDKLVARLEPGDSLVAWKVDRLGRNALEAILVAHDLHARGVRIVITTLGLDTRTPTGRMVFGILAQLAEHERETLIERTRAGLAAARKRGSRLGRRHTLTGFQQREARRMREEEGKSYAEIGAVLGVSRSIVWRVVNAGADAPPPDPISDEWAAAR